MLEEMKEHYGAYNESMGAYNRGNYSAGQDGMKALENTMELFTEFTQKMIEEAESPEEKQIVKKYLSFFILTILTHLRAKSKNIAKIVQYGIYKYQLFDVFSNAENNLSM